MVQSDRIDTVVMIVTRLRCARTRRPEARVGAMMESLTSGTLAGTGSFRCEDCDYVVTLAAERRASRLPGLRRRELRARLAVRPTGAFSARAAVRTRRRGARGGLARGARAASTEPGPVPRLRGRRPTCGRRARARVDAGRPQPRRRRALRRPDRLAPPRADRAPARRRARARRPQPQRRVRQRRARRVARAAPTATRSSSGRYRLHFLDAAPARRRPAEAAARAAAADQARALAGSVGHGGEGRTGPGARSRAASGVLASRR